MPLGIDPTVDYAFKKLFAVPENSDLLIHLLNAVIQPESPIVVVELLNPFNEKKFSEDKLSVLDIKARDSAGKWYNVEMQTRAVHVLRQRLPYYNSLLFADQLSEGDGYELLAAAITVCFLNDVLFPGVESPHLSFTLCDCARKVQLSDCLQIHTIELPKYNFKEDSLGKADPLVKWAFFLSHAAELEVSDLKRLLPEKAFIKATGVMEMIGATPQQRAFYESRRKAELDYKSFVAAARQEERQIALREGRQEGREEGLKEGLIGQVRLLQDLLHEPVTSEADLMGLESEALTQLCSQLKKRLLPE